MLISVLGTVPCNAQLFDGSVHFYIKGGEALTANTIVTILYFNEFESRVYINSRDNKNEVGQNLQKDRNYYSPEKYRFGAYLSGKYRPSMSTSSRDVYGERSSTQSMYTGPVYPGCPIYVETPNNYYLYYGFAKDKSSYIFWKEDLDGNILKKTYFIEVSIEDLLPKTVNRDFLYE